MAIRSLFEAPTVEGLAKRLDEAQAARPALLPAVRPAEVPLSFAQRRLWFLDRLEGESDGNKSATYTIPLALRLTGALDHAALEAALGDLVARHESLRTLFPDTLGVPRQLILDADAARPRLQVVAVCKRTLPTRSPMRHSGASILAGELPIRARLFVLGTHEHVLLLLLHHIAADGWSLAPLARDLARAYAARCGGDAPELPALPVQYADYTLWQHELLGAESDPQSAIARQLAFWTKTLADLPEQLDLPGDRPRPAVASHRGDTVPFVLSAELHGACWGWRARAAPACSWCCRLRLAALLCRLGAGHDIPIGSPIAGRTDGALDELIGFFVNTLVLRTDASGNPSFRALIERVRATNLAAYSHQDLPFERLVEVLNPARSLSRHPLFQVMLALQNNAPVSFERAAGAHGALRAGHHRHRQVRLVAEPGRAARSGRRAGRHPRGARIRHRPVRSRPAIEALVGRLVRLLEAAVADADRPIGSLDILTPDERHTILHGWNDTARPIPAATVPELFAAQAARTPDAVAVVFEDESLSYARARCARQPAGASPARARASAPRCVVGLCVERSPEMLVGLLGILKAGGAYLPLDPDYPQPRLAYMLTDADACRCCSPSRRCATGCPPPRPHRVPRRGRADDRNPAHRRAHPHARSAQHCLRHLHLGIDRRAQGDRHPASERGAAVRRHATLVPVRRGRRLELCSIRSRSTSRSGSCGERCCTAAGWWWCLMRSAARLAIS